MFSIPTVPTAQELLDKAFRRAKKARGRGRSRLDKSRSLSLSRVEALTETVRSTLKRVYSSFPSFDQLSPFYQELVDIIAGVDETKRALGRLRWTYEKVGKVTREARAALRRSQGIGDVEKARKACYGRVSSLVEELKDPLTFLGVVRDDLKKLPIVDPAQPTLVIAGTPNVGKSQLVRTISTGRPKVATYPFTTLDLFLGHFELDATRWQVMDTPGLLDRPIHERNELERKALVALRHLASVIIFLLDPTETCGYPMEEQESLLAELRDLYPEIPILDVENKADLGPPAGERLQVSALTGQGTKTLLSEVFLRVTSPAPEDAPPQRAE